MKAIAVFLLVLTPLFAGAQTASFPLQYAGTWKGNLEIFNAEGRVVNAVPMELYINKTDDADRWIWKTVYNSTDIRDYELVVIDAGKYGIDEKNGIFLDMRLFGTKAFTCFEVDGYLIYDSYTFSTDEIIFELTSSAPQAVTKSGTSEQQVTSYPQIAYQKAILKRIK